MIAVTKRPPDRVDARAKLLQTSEVAGRVIRMLASSASVDRHGDTIAQDGWALANYNANPVILWGHDRDALPIGKAVSAVITGRGLELSIQFPTADEYPFADTVYKLLQGGYLNAGSVGFRPIEWTIADDGGWNFLKQELLEFSIVTIPSNPTALALAKSAGLDLTPIAAKLAKSAPTECPELRKALAIADAPKLPASTAGLNRARMQTRINANRLHA